MIELNNIKFPIKRANGDSFYGFEIANATFESGAMSLDDSISGDVSYHRDDVVFTMLEYIEYNGIRYMMVDPPSRLREGMVSDNSDLKGMTRYSFKFYHPMYVLSSYPFNDVAVSADEQLYLSEQRTFSWMGTLVDYAAKLNKNLQNTIWCVIINSSVDNDTKNKKSDVLPFDGATIAEAVKTGYDTWNVPYTVIEITSSNYPELYNAGKRFAVQYGTPSDEFGHTEETRTVTTNAWDNEVRYYDTPMSLNEGDTITLVSSSSLSPILFYKSPTNEFVTVASGGDESYTVEEDTPPLYVGVGGGEEGTTVTFKIDSHFVLAFGKELGLKNNTRTPKKNKVITRLAGYGSENNVPYGYPQIIWTGDATWDYTLNNQSGVQTVWINGVAKQAMSYPIYWGIVNGQRTRLIKHPFTRKTLMPTIYATSVNNKVNPRSSEYDPDTELVDYIDADYTYPHPINPTSPVFERHEFEVKPELGEAFIIDAKPYVKANSYCLTEEAFEAILRDVRDNTFVEKEAELMDDIIVQYKDSQYYQGVEVGNDKSMYWHGGPNDYWEHDISEGYDYNYMLTWYVGTGEVMVHFRYRSTVANMDYDVQLRIATDWNNYLDKDNNLKQPYFGIKLPILDFDLYACASVTESMSINMRSGACMGCTFDVEVDWDDYKKNFYHTDGTFDPIIHTTTDDGHVRDGSKYPDTRNEQVWLTLKKDENTFGRPLPDEYQYPKGTTLQYEGDQFVILGISLPMTYVTNAQTRLQSEMEDFLMENNVFYYEYPAKLDEYVVRKRPDLFATLSPNNVLRVKDGSDIVSLYISKLTIKYGSSPIPQFDVTLTDEIDVQLNQIGQVVDTVGKLSDTVNVLRQERQSNMLLELQEQIGTKLSKIEDDTAQGFLKLLKGFQVGDVFTSGLFGEGGIFRRNDDGTTYLEADRLYIRMKAYFDSVEVREYSHVSGNRIASLAGVKCSRVEWYTSAMEITSDLSEVDFFRCYFKVDDGSDTLTNDFVAGDLAFCEKSTPTTSSPNAVHRYWRLVQDLSTTKDSNGEMYIDLSNATGEYEDGSDVPLIGDSIVQLGNIDTASRRGAIIEYVSGEDAPSYQIYQDLGSDSSNLFSLANKNYVSLGFSTATRRAYLKVYGDFYFGDRQGASYIQYNAATRQMELKAHVSFESTFGPANKTFDQAVQAATWTQQQLEQLITDETAQEFADMETAIETLQRQSDAAIDTFFYDGAPYPSNENPSTPNLPYSSWNPDDTPNVDTSTYYKNHVGDLYYDKQTGYSYRFFNTVEGINEQATAQCTEWLSGEEVFYNTTGITLREGETLTAVSSTSSVPVILVNVSGTLHVHASGANSSITYAQADGHMVYVGIGGFTGSVTYTRTRTAVYRFTKLSDSDVTRALQAASAAQSTADSKMRVFVAQPVPPYEIGDLWVQGTSGDLMRCQTAKASGQTFASSDWVKATKYTDDTALNTFLAPNGTYQQNLATIRSQVDMKAQTWYQGTDPSTAWATDEERAMHVGDLWYKTSNNENTTWFYKDNGASSSPRYSWAQQNVPREVFNSINGKSSIFVGNPTLNEFPTNYKGGDMWILPVDATINNVAYKAGDVLTTYDSSTTYNAAHWRKRIRYTDDSTYAYLGVALNKNTDIEGGVVLTSKVLMRDPTIGSTVVWGGISGEYDQGQEMVDEDTGDTYYSYALGHGIAAWFGGNPVDVEADPTGDRPAKIAFRFDGSGYLANGRLSWDNLGNLAMAGFLKKQKTIITQANFSYYFEGFGSGNPKMDFDRLGTMIEFQYVPATGTGFYLPAFGVTYSSDDLYTLEEIRSYIGTSVIVYNNSGQTIIMYGGGAGERIDDGDFYAAECYISKDAYDNEVVAWREIAIGHIRTESEE